MLNIATDMGHVEIFLSIMENPLVETVAPRPS